MSKLESLRKCENINDLAHLLGFQPKKMAYILYGIQDEYKYYEFTIPKKDGGKREITAPVQGLKIIQKRLSDYLYDCLEELKPEQKHKSRPKRQKTVSHGYKKGLSIATNADAHKNKRYVFNLDLEDFFSSINFGRVRGYFIQNSNFKLNPKVATIIAKIACHQDALPQGSPCSPVVSDLIGQILDGRLTKLAKKHNCTYSRYVDDITFSCNKKIFPQQIARKKIFSTKTWFVGNGLNSIINKSGFNSKASKTRMHYNNSRQLVTGLVVNKTVNVNIDYYRQARAMCNSLFKNGHYYMPIKASTEKVERHSYLKKIKRLLKFWNNDQDDSIKTADPELETSLDRLEGILSYIYYIKKYRNYYADLGYRKSRHDGYIKPTHDGDDHKYPPMNRTMQYSDESHQIANDGIKNLYAKFLFFKHFYKNDMPTIICEGHTDIIYLKCALKKLVDKYPTLIEKKANKKDKNKIEYIYKIRFLNTDDRLRDFFKMAEGVGGLKFLLKAYSRLLRRYSCEGLSNPVIMIVDNDNDGRGLESACNQKEYKSSRQKKNHFVTDNLYAFVLPNIGENKDTVIEDYFDKKVLEKHCKGKTLNKTNKKLKANEISKSYFAVQIIRKNQNSISFKNFEKIFNEIEKIQKHYDKKRSA